MNHTVVKSRGVALLIVLMISAVISVVIVIQQLKSKQSIELAQQARDFVEAQSKAESLKSDILFLFSTTNLWLLGPTADNVARLNLPAQMNFYGRTFQWDGVEVNIKDASGLIPLLPFSERAWQDLFGHFSPDQADALVATLKDWYDKDDFVHLNGAERREYGSAFLPRNERPQTVEELKMLLGMTPGLWETISPHLTYIGQEVLNPDYAADTLLPALVGQYKSEQMQSSRATGEDVKDFKITEPISEDTTYGPTNRLKIEIKAVVGRSAYHETFTLLKSQGNPKLIYQVEYIPGFGRVITN